MSAIRVSLQRDKGQDGELKDEEVHALQVSQWFSKMVCLTCLFDLHRSEAPQLQMYSVCSGV